MKNKCFWLAAITCGVLTDVAAQSSADFPAKPVRVIVAVDTGSSSDIQARMFSQKLSENLKRQFFVENRPNYGQAYGSFIKSPADGYTLLAVASAFSIVPSLITTLPDPLKDYAPISLVNKAPLLLLSHPSLPAKSVKELIALAKSKSNEIAIGVTARGTLTHLGAVLLASGSDIKLNIIPYKGTGQIITDTMAGHIQVAFGNVIQNLSHAKSGRLRALAVTSTTRSSVVPDLPTIAESGVPGYDVTTWHGWLAPAATPPMILARLSDELARAVKAPEIAARLIQDGVEPIGSTPEQFQQLLGAEVPRWRKIIKDIGLTNTD